MARVLVIPDTHLKLKMFDLADKILRENRVDYVVQLGDNLDDFYCCEDEYRKHSIRMIKFRDDHPNTIWLWGNHEVSYILDHPVTGNTYWGELYARTYKESFDPKYVHMDGKIIFSHAGVFEEFVRGIGLRKCKDARNLVDRINRLNLEKLWRDDSPIWARPQYNDLTIPMLLSDYIQVVGHTPVREIDKTLGVISTDVFSTNWGKKLGVEQMVIVDTESGEFEQVKINFRKVFGEER